MNENEQPVNLEVLQPSAIEALERASVDIQVATAHKFPRDLVRFKKTALQMATIDEETAESCIYVRPVGKKDGKMQYAEGPSIRMAEIVAASYCNLRVASRIIEQTLRYVKCEGVAHDLETNYAGKNENVEPTVTSKGDPYSESMRAVVAKACLAKAYRDAVFKVVPRALCKTVIDAAKNIINGKDKPLAERIKRVQAWVATLKIDEMRVLTALGKKAWSELTADNLTTLTGLKTAISEGDTRIDEAFPPLEKADAGGGAKGPESTGLEKSQQQTGKTAFGPSEKPKDEKKQEPAKTAPDASKGGEPAKTPPPAEKSTPAPSSEQAQASKEPVTPPQSDEKAEQDAGLAPLPPFERKSGDSDEVSNIKFLAHNARLTEEDVMNWARKDKLAKENQKSLSELATGKLINLGKAWQNNPKEFAEKIRAAKTNA